MGARIDLTESEKLTRREEMLTSEASVLGIPEPPTIDLVRWISPDEYPAIMTECERDQGFNVSVSEDGLGVSSEDVPESQTSALELASYTCTAMFTVDPRYFVPLNEDQKRIVYDYLVNAYIPCLRNGGYSVGEPPTLEVYLGEGGLDVWTPRKELTALPAEELDVLDVTCPPTPPTDAVYGS